MVWLRSLAITLALGSATWASAQATATQTAVKDKSDNLELRLVPKDIQMGVPQAFTFMLINISDHDVRIPSLSVDCAVLDTGSLWLALTFIPLVAGPHGNGTRCIADLGDRPTIMERIKSWKVVGPGESLSIEENKDRLPYKEKEAGKY